MLRLVIGLLVATAATAQPHLPPDGGGPAPGLDGPSDALSPEARATIVAQLAEARATLGGTARRGGAPLALSWPLRFDASVGDVHMVSNFVDLNPTNPGRILDYACGARTYDVTGYDHAGIDYALWPFDWELMDAGAVEVVAAAPGVILGTADGEADRSCSFSGVSTPWNVVYLQHDDGSQTWYGHLKTGSVTTKRVGERVEAGERLGLIGSSGNSTGPHLHFEVHGPDGRIIEPHAGACNPSVPTSWWVDPRPYRDSALNAVATHRAAPAFATCPVTRNAPNRADAFDPGDVAYFAAYYRDHVQGQSSSYRVLRPDGSTQWTWTGAPSAPFYAASYYYWWRTLPTTAPVGTWTFEVTFQGETRRHPFTVGAAVAAEPPAEPSLQLDPVAPSPAAGTATVHVRTGAPMAARIWVADVLGREVAALHDGPLAVGEHRFTLDAGRLPAGTYLVVVEGDARRTTRPFTVAR